MTTIGRLLTAVALTTSCAGVAAAQEPPPQQGEAQPPPQGYAQPQQGYAQPPQQYAPPPGYAPPPVYAAPAGYEPPPPRATVTLGAAGQFAISDDMNLIATRYTQTYMGSSISQTAISLRPAVDVFVAPNLSIGGQLLLGLNSNDTSDSTTIGVSPRIGYNIPFGSMVSMWPRVSVTYAHFSTSLSSGGPASTGHTFSFFAFVPVLFQPVPHFFIGGGPYVSKDLETKIDSMDSYKSTYFGLQSTIGGYFGGT